MPRWLRIIRGMIGTGLTFGAGVGVVASVIGVLAWLANGITGRELMQIVGKFSVVAFLLGVAFSGVLAITARGRQFNKVSLRLVGALGAGAGLLYFVFLALNGGRNWSAQNAIVNLVLLTVKTLLMAMQQHNLKEEQILYPIADNVLSAERESLLSLMQKV